MSPALYTINRWQIIEACVEGGHCPLAPPTDSHVEVDLLAEHPVRTERLSWKSNQGKQSMLVKLAQGPQQQLRLEQAANYYRATCSTPNIIAWGPRIWGGDLDYRWLALEDVHLVGRPLSDFCLQGYSFSAGFWKSLGKRLGRVHLATQEPNLVFSQAIDHQGMECLPHPEQSQKMRELQATLLETNPEDSLQIQQLHRRFLDAHQMGLLGVWDELKLALDTEPLNTLIHGWLCADAIISQPHEGARIMHALRSHPSTAWMEVGALVAHTQVLNQLAFSGWDFALPLLSGYLEVSPHIGAVSGSQCTFLRRVYQVAALELIRLMLGREPHSFSTVLADPFLREAFLKQALSMAFSPHEMETYRTLSQ